MTQVQGDQEKTQQPVDETQEAATETVELETAEGETSSNLLEEMETLKDQLLRALAEVDNTKKRAIREQEDARKYAVTSFAKDVLGVLDNLGRALESVPPEKAKESELLDNLVSGITMTQQALISACGRHGIQQVEALGAKFDPHVHQAMCEIEGEPDQAGKVVQVMQEGYQIHGRLLRPALVGVGKAASKGNAESTETTSS